MEATLMSTWEQRVAFMKEEVPLPSSEPSAPLNKQPRSTPIPKKRSEKSLQPHSGSSVPEAGQRRRPRRPSQGQRSRWHGSGPERQLLSPPAPERGFPPWERGWGLSRGQEGPSCQVSATSGCGESPAHHIPWRTLTRDAPAFNAALFSIKGSIVGTNSLAPELVPCPSQSLMPGDPGSSAPFMALGSIPRALPKSPAEEVSSRSQPWGPRAGASALPSFLWAFGPRGPRRCLSLPSPDILHLSAKHGPANYHPGAKSGAYLFF